MVWKGIDLCAEERKLQRSSCVSLFIYLRLLYPAKSSGTVKIGHLFKNMNLCEPVLILCLPPHWIDRRSAASPLACTLKYFVISVWKLNFFKCSHSCAVNCFLKKHQNLNIWFPTQKMMHCSHFYPKIFQHVDAKFFSFSSFSFHTSLGKNENG